MITLTHVYVLAGLMFAAFAVLTVLDRAHPRRLGTAAFWALLAVSFLFGSWLSDLMNGVLVLLLALLAGFRLLGQSSPPTTSSSRSTETTRVSMGVRPGGISSICDTSISPWLASCNVRGIGVAVITTRCGGRLPFAVSISATWLAKISS